MNETEERLRKAFNRTFRSHLESIDIERKDFPEWDSMKHAELIIQLQKEFKMKFEIRSVLEVQNLKDFLPLIR